MQQQLFIEERIRSEGDSGIKTTRLNSIGTENYRLGSHTDKNKVRVFFLILIIIEYKKAAMWGGQSWA